MTTTNEWKDVNVSKKKVPPKVFTEEIYILTNMLRNGACIRCINRSCKNNEPHGEQFPDRISNFVHNPLHINGLNQYFIDANLDFNGKQPFYTICNYLMGKCKNCEDGRIKYVDFNNEKLAVCYPSLDRDNNKITVGMHIDIKLILKGKKYEVSALPFELIINKKELYLNEDMISIKDEWPSLDVDQHKRKRITSPVMSFAHIKNSLKNDNIIINEEKNINKSDSTHFYPIQEKKNNKSENDNINNYIDDQIRIYKNKEYDLLDELDYIKNKYDNLLDELDFIKNENSNIRFENFELKNKLDDSRRSSSKNLVHNNEKYDEIIYNIDNINTRVTNQFLKTEYSEYTLI